jgi:hypothetical protein
LTIKTAETNRKREDKTERVSSFVSNRPTTFEVKPFLVRKTTRDDTTMYDVVFVLGFSLLRIFFVAQPVTFFLCPTSHFLFLKKKIFRIFFRKSLRVTA